MSTDDFRTNPDRACAPITVDAELFYSASDRHQNLARRICNGDPKRGVPACPVQHACLTHAIHNGEREGVWAGVLMSSPEERRNAANLVPPPPPTPDRPVKLTRAQKMVALQDGVREHWKAGQPDSIIALKLGITIGAVVNIRRRLGLPALYGPGGRRLPQPVNA
jgi:hypothetical protein